VNSAPSPVPSSQAEAAPFAGERVSLTREELIQLTWDAQYWKSMHGRAVQRCLRQRSRYKRILRHSKEQAALREQSLQVELEHAQALVRDLRQRLFGKKSEGRQASEAQVCGAPSSAARGQRRGAPGHGRTLLPGLAERSESIPLDCACCAQCGKDFAPFVGTEDSEVLEIEVQAYRRVIHRQRYRPLCRCPVNAGIITAPAPARLINKGKFGLSVWVQVLLDKFLYGQPLHRSAANLASLGLSLSEGSLVGGLQALAPLFEPVNQALLTQLRMGPHWHADETRWAVFADTPGKVGHRWYLWVFQSAQVVHFALDPSRAARVIEEALNGVDSGILSCDRYVSYKCFARLNPGIVLSFCWAHQRRDFLDFATAHPEEAPWALAWVDRIARLYQLNAVRVASDATHRAQAQMALLAAIEEMGADRDRALAQVALHPAGRKVLHSMRKHWAGLCVFVANPAISMDNNSAERALRPAVVGRKNFYGSGAPWSGQLTACMYSIMGTLKLWDINARTWLGAYLQACAANGNRSPADLNAFLPWAMDEPRLKFMRACPNASTSVQNSTPNNAPPNPTHHTQGINSS
jgi:transposase